MKYGLSEKIVNQINDIIKKYEQYNFKLFGSRARGDYKKTSDIDIAIFENINKKDEYRIRDDLAKGIASLKAGLEEPATELAIDGVLHRFEFTFELAWKTIKDYLEYIGIVEKTGSLREAIKNSI